MEDQEREQQPKQKQSHTKPVSPRKQIMNSAEMVEGRWWPNANDKYCCNKDYPHSHYFPKKTASPQPTTSAPTKALNNNDVIDDEANQYYERLQQTHSDYFPRAIDENLPIAITSTMISSDPIPGTSTQNQEEHPKPFSLPPAIASCSHTYPNTQANDQFQFDQQRSHPNFPPVQATPKMMSELSKTLQKSAANFQPRPPPTQALFPPQVKSRIQLPRLTTLAEDLDLIHRMSATFPSAPGVVLEQTVRAYHGREALIRAMLMSLGYKQQAPQRDAHLVTTYMDCDDIIMDIRRNINKNKQLQIQQQQQKPQQIKPGGSVELTSSVDQLHIKYMLLKRSSKEMLGRLMERYPNEEEKLLKFLMYKHAEIESEIINAMDAIIRFRESIAPTGNEIVRPQRKSRYLKFLYPNSDDIKIYHLLHCNDLNAMKATEMLSRHDYKQEQVRAAVERQKLLQQHQVQHPDCTLSKGQKLCCRHHPTIARKVQPIQQPQTSTSQVPQPSLSQEPQREDPSSRIGQMP